MFEVVNNNNRTSTNVNQIELLDVIKEMLPDIQREPLVALESHATLKLSLQSPGGPIDLTHLRFELSSKNILCCTKN